MRDLHYQMFRGEAGVFAELYLPKKAHYQGVLYDTLTEGFSIDRVRSHFIEHRFDVENYLADAKILYNLSDLAEPEDIQLTPVAVENMPDLFFGYSMYEVDGVFRGKSQSQVVVEERTQVIRMMFRFDVDRCLSDLDLSSTEKDSANLAGEAYLRSHHWRRDLFNRDYLQLPSAGLTAQQLDQITIRVARWARYICIFVFGFIVFKVCKRINELFANELLDHPEEEIWVTFFWNLVINRIRSTGGYPTGA